MSLGSSTIVSLTDPDEGDYTCTVKWTADTDELPIESATNTITYKVPTGETTNGSGGWVGEPGFTTAYKWRATVSGEQGVSFGGRKVWEEDGGSVVDTCYKTDGTGPAGRWTGIPAAAADYPWNINGDNTYGDDPIGMTEILVNQYRSAGQAPCRFETDQKMLINVPGKPKAHYKTNRIKFGMTIDTVWSQRDTHAPISKPW